MRTVVVYELLSLDGVAEHPREFITDFDEVMRENLGRVIASQETALLGRRTYDDWATFWPGSDIEPFASFINSVQKFVATSTPLQGYWTNSAVIGVDVVEFSAGLKQGSGGDIGVHASISLAETLLESGLVDALRLVVAPAPQMRGRKLFDGGQTGRFSLTRNVASPTGYLLLDYQRMT
jgi:dihydrofolate reductase